jgi:hypothetical protein
LLVCGLNIVSDNHKYLLVYWCLAIGFCLQLPSPLKALAFNGRLMIGLVFCFATVAKVLSEVYFSGDMFRYLLVYDDRFFEIANLLGGLTREMHQQNAIGIPKAMEQLAHTIPVATTAQMSTAAQWLTGWTLFVECLIAIAFLIPKGVLYRWRDYFLILFMLTTYLPAHIVGFGWLLAIMGFAQCGTGDNKRRILYILTMSVIFSIPVVQPFLLK